MELDNAINQAIREIDTRFDFKNTGSKIELEGEKILIEADTEERAKAALDVRPQPASSQSGTLVPGKRCRADSSRKVRSRRHSSGRFRMNCALPRTLSLTLCGT